MLFFGILQVFFASGHKKKAYEIKSYSRLYLFTTSINEKTIQADECISDQLYNTNSSRISSSSTLCLYRCTFRSMGTSSNRGGSIYISPSSSLTLESKSIFSDCLFDKCFSISGGAICIQSSSSYHSYEMTNCNFTNNFAIDGTLPYGGAILLITAKGMMTTCNFNHNYCINTDSQVNGGAIYGQDTMIELIQCTFNGNYIQSNPTDSCNSLQGGAFSCYGSNFSINKCTFNSNSIIPNNAEYQSLGGALSLRNSKGKIDECKFSLNSIVSGESSSDVDIWGCTLCAYSTDLNLTKCDFNDNSGNSNAATNDVDGGAMFFRTSNFKVSHCTFVNNNCNSAKIKASALGGAFFFIYGDGIIEDCIFSCNHVIGFSEGGSRGRTNGAACYASRSKIIIKNCIYENNYAKIEGNDILSSGGALFITVTICNLENCSFNNNKAYSKQYGIISYVIGGAVYCDDSNGTINECNFINNTAYADASADINDCNGYGGAVNLLYSSFTFMSCDFLNNTCFSTGNISFAYSGAVLYQDCPSTSFFECKFIDNIVKSTVGNSNACGGALFIHSSDGLINECVMLRNYAISEGYEAFSYGGAIYVNNASVQFIICNFSYNIATGDILNEGGGIVSYFSLITFQNTNFTSNEAKDLDGTNDNRGGALSFSISNVTIEECIFNDNEACYGGDIYISKQNENECSICISKCQFNRSVNNGLITKFLILFNYIVNSISVNKFINNSFYLTDSSSQIIFGRSNNNKIRSIFSGNCLNPYDSVHYISNLGTYFIYDQTGTNIITFIEAFEKDCIPSSMEFTYSNLFSKSEAFTESNVFIPSSIFTKSNEFSNSFRFTNSDIFAKSNEFTYSSRFTNSDDFTESNAFSQTEILYKSIAFTKSHEFTQSIEFTNSNVFSCSNTIDNSTHYFTASDTFTPHPTKTPIPDGAIVSSSCSLTMVNVKTVILSLSNVLSNSYIWSYNAEQETYSFYLVQYNFFNLIPYIIISISPSYVQTVYAIELVKKKGISAEQLIGAVCGSAAAVFIILSIIIFAIQKKQRINEFINNEISFSDSEDDKNDNGAETFEGINVTNNLENNDIDWM